MIIAFSGKKQSGKDTAGIITQTLLAYPKADNETIKKYLKDPMDNPDWKIKKFASYLKQVTADLTGCTVEDLEIEEKKNEVIFTKYRFQNKYIQHIHEFEDIEQGLEIYNKSVETYINSGYDSIDAINENVTYEEIGITRRNVLERLGDDVARTIHSSIWINNLFSKYKKEEHFDLVLRKFNDGELLHHINPVPTYRIPSNPSVPKEHWGKLIQSKEYEFTEKVINNRFPKWIITDTRYPNEAQAIIDRGGIIIRLNRTLYNYDGASVSFEKLKELWFRDTGEEITLKYANKHARIVNSHRSETALDDYTGFNYIIDNDKSVFELINNIRKILIDNKLI